MPVHIYTSRALEGSHREHPYIRRYAPSSRFRFDRRDRNAYIPPRKRGREGESAVARSEGSTQGSVGSIAPTCTCALARARSLRWHVCPHATRFVVCAPPRSSLDQGRSLFTPSGSTWFQFTRFPPLSLSSSSSSFLGIRTPGRPARHLSSASRPRADIVRDICALRLSDCQLSCAVSSQSDQVDFICVCEPRPKRLLYIRNRPAPIEFRSGFEFRRYVYTPGCCLGGFPMNVC